MKLLIIYIVRNLNIIHHVKINWKKCLQDLKTNILVLIVISYPYSRWRHYLGIQEKYKKGISKFVSESYVCHLVFYQLVSKSGKTLSEKIAVKVKEFYWNDINNRILPGKKEFHWISSETGRNYKNVFCFKEFFQE